MRASEFLPHRRSLWLRSSMTEYPQQSVVSFVENGSVSLSLRFVDGRVQGWPLHLISTWSLSADGRSLDIHVVDADPLTRLELRGRNLAEVAEAIASGRGGIVSVHGERYLSLAAIGRAYVVSAEAKRTQEPNE